MLAAAVTVWVLFSYWLIVACLPAPPLLGRVAMALLATELVVLLLWSYGTEHCVEADCRPLAQAAGIAARVDVPILAALFVAASIALMRRRAARELAE